MHVIRQQKRWSYGMKDSIITFIGGGNMATSLIGGLIETGVDASKIRVADPNPNPLLNQRFSIRCYNDNNEAIQGADVVVLAVKPQILPDVAKSLADQLPKDKCPLFISIAAGIRSDAITRWLGEEHAVPIVRVMPNTPSLVQSGASALFAGEHVSQTQRALAENILRAVGIALWLDDENQMDAVTALSGSGPAYFFLVMEVMQKAGMELGLSSEQARLLTLQTAFGAAKMALETNEDAATLRTQVTSKGGTTEQALNTLQEGNIQDLFKRALESAAQRSKTLAEQLGEQ